MTGKPIPTQPKTLRETVEGDVLVPLIGAPPALSAQAAFGISDRQARRLAKAGRIPTLKPGKRLMVPTAFVRRVLDGEKF